MLTEIIRIDVENKTTAVHKHVKSLLRKKQD